MNGGNWMPLAGGLILLVVAGYFGFQGLDSFGLPQKTGTGVVISKEHVPSKKTYRTDYIAGRARAIPQVTPDLYVIKFRMGSEETSTAVDRSVFDAANNGDRVAVSYQETRLTGKLRVMSVRSEAR
jgi:hypothetical protein